MAMQNEYEIITHNNANFHVFLVNLLYRTPHIHKDYEISLLLDGALSVHTADKTYELSEGDIFVTNPFSSHELSADKPAMILSLQVSPLFFSSYYPQIDHTEFDVSVIHANCVSAVRDNASAAHNDSSGMAYSSIYRLMFDLAFCFFKKESFYELQCALLLNQLFWQLLVNYPHHIVEEKNKITTQVKGERMRKITHYIDEHFTEKLLLSDIAEQEELDLYYLSHFFKNSFGMSFQNYLTRIRCERARQLLILTDYSLLDISISCGFSDVKYFNKGFLAQYGSSPKEYRKSFKNAQLDQQQKSMLTTQEFLSEEASLIVLEQKSLHL